MAEPVYAVVSYIGGELQKFVDQLRASLTPAQAHLRAHITLLPPRPLLGPKEAAQLTLAKLCRELGPVEVTFVNVGVFVPITPTVYLSIERGADQVRAVHEKLNTAEFFGYEALPYVPHLTVAAMARDEDAERAAQIVRQRWAEYKGARSATLTEVTLAVDPELENHWDDLVTFPLGG
jgi:2'-5' RNA ligase